MHKVLMSYLLLALLLGLNGCSQQNDSSTEAPLPAPQSPTSPTPIPGQDLSAKTLQEVLVIKYDMAVLHCRLWVQAADQIDKSLLPNAEATWNLLKDYVPQKTLELIYTGPPQSVDLKLLVANVYLANGFFKSSNGQTSDFKNSPVIDLRYSFAATPISNNGLEVQDRGMGGKSVYEKVDQEIFSRSNLLPNIKVNALKYFECTIETEIKPEFQNEFKVR
jgi:hypothetical protein